MESVALVCNTGLGDAILFERLGYALSRAGYKVHIYSEFLLALARWYPSLQIFDYPADILQPQSPFWSKYQLYVFQEYAPGSHLAATINRAWVLGESFCRKGHTWLDHKQQFLKEKLGIRAKLEASICAPLQVQYRKNPQRVVIHPTSLKEEKNWPSKKFIELACRLQAKGWMVNFCATPYEKKIWDPWLATAGLDPMHSMSLDALACYIYESGYFIGNDSGVAHLAPAMGIPTLKIFDRSSRATFWSGGWPCVQNILPLPLPTRSLRVRFWKNMLGVGRVESSFERMVERFNANPIGSFCSL